MSNPTMITSRVAPDTVDRIYNEPKEETENGFLFLFNRFFEYRALIWFLDGPYFSGAVFSFLFDPKHNLTRQQKHHDPR